MSGAPSASDTIRGLWQDILDKDDRTSPEEYPDMALITFEEFEAAALSTRAALRERVKVLEDALRLATKDAGRWRHRKLNDDEVIDVRIGDLRAARRALTPATEAQETTP